MRESEDREVVCPYRVEWVEEDGTERKAFFRLSTSAIAFACAMDQDRNPQIRLNKPKQNTEA